MKSFLHTLSFSLILIGLSTTTLAQNANNYNYDSNNKNPFGLLNPDAPAETGDYAKLIGVCDCKSYRIAQEGTRAKPVDMTWTFKYIMNGTAVHDETLKADGGHTGSIRQYSADDDKWYVHYFTSQAPTASLPTWEGHKMNDAGEIILHKAQKAPNGMDGFYRTRFYNISDDGFTWMGSWVNQKENEQFKLDTWNIECQKRQ